MINLLDILRGSETYQSLLPYLAEDSCQFKVEGLKGSSKAYLISTLAQDMPDTTFLIATPSQEEAEKLFHDLFAFSSAGISDNQPATDSTKIPPDPPLQKEGTVISSSQKGGNGTGKEEV